MGRNGAGKSTTLKAIMGLLAQARAAAVVFLGRDISDAEPHRIARLGLGCVPEDRRIFTDLTRAREPRGRPPAAARAARRRWTEDAARSSCSPTSARCPTGPAAA